MVVNKNIFLSSFGARKFETCVSYFPAANEDLIDVLRSSLSTPALSLGVMFSVRHVSCGEFTNEVFPGRSVCWEFLEEHYQPWE